MSNPVPDRARLRLNEARAAAVRLHKRALRRDRKSATGDASDALTAICDTIDLILDELRRS